MRIVHVHALFHKAASSLEFVDGICNVVCEYAGQCSIADIVPTNKNSDEESQLSCSLQQRNS
jgi:hypothetical protein